MRSSSCGSNPTPKPMSRSLSRLTQLEAERFVRILDGEWTVSHDESALLDISLLRKGWMSKGSTLLCEFDKFRTAWPILEPHPDTFKMEDGKYRAVFLMGDGRFSGKWVLK